MTNQIGITVDRELEWKIFDALPQWAKDHLRYAAQDVSCKAYAEIYVRYKKTGLADTIERSMLDVLRSNGAPVCLF